MTSRRDVLKIGVAGVGLSLFSLDKSVAEERHSPYKALRLKHAPYDRKWLKSALQTAIQLEFSTIPLYLCSAWSIADDADPVKATILGIAREEMSHVGHACNMLVAIGGKPDLTSSLSVPVYPGPLPGGLHPGLVATLRRLTPSALDVFMAIENPLDPVISGSVLKNTSTTSISMFYQSIWETFKRLKLSLNIERQVDGVLGLFALQTLDDVGEAINGIIQQGEGSPVPAGVTPPEGHYYRFAELHHGSRIAQNTEQEWGFYGDVVPFPEVLPMADIPPGGYQEADVPADVWEEILLFDRTYTRMLKNLEVAWTGGGPDSLLESIGQMKDIDRIGESLIRKPISIENPNLGNYGPCFRLV